MFKQGSWNLKINTNVSTETDSLLNSKANAALEIIQNHDKNKHFISKRSTGILTNLWHVLVGGDETQDELEMVNAITRNLEQDNNGLHEITRKLVHQESMLERSQSTLEKESRSFITCWTIK
jgi:hypothetical protein